MQRTKANISRLASALRAFGFVELADECGRLEQPDRMATLGKPPLRIDIMNHIDGVAFADAWRGRLISQFGDHEVASSRGLAITRSDSWGLSSCAPSSSLRAARRTWRTSL